MEISRRNHTVRNLAIAGTLAAATGIAAFGASQLNKNEGTNPELTPPAGGIVEPSASPTPTLPKPGETIVIPTPTATPTEKPTPTPDATIPTESYAPATLAPTENLSEFQQKLENWVNGKIKVPDSKKFTIHGKPAGLNIIDSQPQPGVWYPGYQSYFLGTQIVDNHLIAYMGSQDKAGNNYYIPLNIGELNKGLVGIMFDDPNRLVYMTGQANSKLIPLEEVQRIMANKLTNDTILYIMSPNEPTEKFDSRISEHDYRAQIELARQFSLWSIETAQGNYKDSALAKKYPLVRALLNKQVTNFDAKELPYVIEFWIPRNDA